MGLDPKIWGPSGWHFIHSVALTFPVEPSKETIKQYQKFFAAVGEVLPCELCRENFKEKMKDSPPKYESAAGLFKWTVDIHNMVNKENGRPELTEEQAMIEFRKNANLEPRVVAPKSNALPRNLLILGTCITLSFVGGFLVARFMKRR